MNILTNEAACWLTRIASADEIKKAVFQLHLDKAPGPDGFSATFYQNN